MSLDQPADFVKHQTLDAFLDGRLQIAQPKSGFRAGLDSVLLGAAVSPQSKSVLDLGAGVGTAALIALSNAEGREALLVDTDAGALAIADANIARNGFGSRARTLKLDAAAGSKPHGTFDAVIANPPYFAEGQGTAATARGAMARQMDQATLDAWVSTAAAAVQVRAEAIFILPTQSLGVILGAFEGRFGALTVLPLSPRPDQPANRILVRGIKGSRAPLTLLASRALHIPAGQDFAPDFEAIFRGRDRLHW